MNDISSQLQEQLKHAIDTQQSLVIQGTNSKAFYGNPVQGSSISLANHSGIVSYEPTELVITALAGTPIHEIEAALHDNNQILPFEPPRFATGGTIGGAIATGLAGPSRPWGGAPRDLLLGCKILDGKSQILNFGGAVMKNVAGYDISRLMAGALGSLGILLEVSLKVLPKPQVEEYITLDIDSSGSIPLLRQLTAASVPVTGACHLGDKTHIRLSGNSASVKAWARKLGGQIDNHGKEFWRKLRDHQLDYFSSDQALWRLSLPPATSQLDCEDHSLIDWAGAQRWVYSKSDASDIREQVSKAGGHATLFRGTDLSISMFHELDSVQQEFHKGLKQRFDPFNILNPGRMYSWL